MENTATTNKLSLIFGDYTLGVKAKDTHYIFSYVKGGLESLNKGDKEWLYREVKPVFWRAMTDNDRGCGFDFQSNMWLGASLKQKLSKTTVTIDGQSIQLPTAPTNNRYSNAETAEEITISFTLAINTVPQTSVVISYTINAQAEMKVSMHYFGQAGLPELPALGVRFIMPTSAKYFEYEGLSGETYPDRLAGGIPGTYRIAGLPVTPYLVPQECGMHMQSKAVKIVREQTLNNADQTKNEFSLEILQDQAPFAFSALPYKAEELEFATHQEELPPARRTVLCVYAKVRGVGGIDSWGTDVTAPYRIDATKDYEVSFIVK